MTTQKGIALTLILVNSNAFPTSFSVNPFPLFTLTASLQPVRGQMTHVQSFIVVDPKDLKLLTHNIFVTEAIIIITVKIKT